MMILKINRKKITVNVLDGFWERIKSFRFKLDPIEEGICFYRKKNINTYLFCQKVDVIFADKNNKVLKISKNTPSEKILFGKKSTFYIYLLKENSSGGLKSGDLLKIAYTKKEKELLEKKIN